MRIYFMVSIMVVPAVCVGCLTRFSSFAATKGSKRRNSRLPGRRVGSRQTSRHAQSRLTVRFCDCGAS
jgi:hypothetical protein